MSNSYGRISFSRPSDSGGFFSNYFSVVSTMGVCMMKNLIPYVDSTNTWFNPTCDFKNDIVIDSSINPWDWWFVQSKEEGREVIEVGLDRGGIPHNPALFVKHPTIPLFRQIVKDHCKIQPRILEEEDQLYKEYIEGKKTLGVLARGTEMLMHHKEYPKVPIDSWSKLIKLCLERDPEIENVFLVTDDRRIIDNVLSTYPDTKYLKHFFRSTDQPEEAFLNKDEPWWLTSPTGDPNHRKRVGEESLIQTRLLARCTSYAGCHSGMNSAVNFFRETPFKANYLA